ncbi:MAG TPA: FIST N-terminal domain-containing protein, partial [Polyangiaceae bacterium]
MRVLSVKGVEELASELGKPPASRPTWALLYGVEGSPFAGVMGALRQRFPQLQVFGTTSFQGVFTQRGFGRGMTLLLADAEDEITPAVVLETTGAEHARESARSACQQIKKQLRGLPTLLLLHATPGFEERILAGVHDAFGDDVPVYGGSAADDALAGNWRVFANGAVCGEGFLLVGLSSPRAPAGGFLGGYLPTGHTGTVTRAEGRVIYEIDGRPAAEVYNAWTDGAIAEELATGGNIMPKTNLRPLARTVSSTHGMPRRLLAHPREVIGTKGALSLFAEISRGDEVTLMTSTCDPLVIRVRRAVQRARGT